MPPSLVQTAYARAGAGQSYECTATPDAPTTPNSLLLVTTIVASYYGPAIVGPEGFTLIRSVAAGYARLAMWYREGAPETTSVKIRVNYPSSIQVRLQEYQGVAQSGALDKVAVTTSVYGFAVTTGQLAATATADHLVVSSVGNQYATTIQQAFSGALALLSNDESPQQWGRGNFDPDILRTRLTVHHAIASQIRSYALSATLSRQRAWLAIIASFKGASVGPARMTSRARSAVTVTGRGDLTVFGKLVSTAAALTSKALVVSGGVARIGPFTHQYRLGGWDGLLVGESTDYRVESVEGLGGWEMRTSDDELPRGDGGIRGTDLQSSRLITFKVNADDPDPSVVEQRLDTLYRALVPQRDSDWDLIWRDPGQELRLLRCRPVNLIRNLDWQQILLLNQTFALSAVDPRHYSASVRTDLVPNTPAGASPTLLSALNAGNGFAYPIIRVTPTSVPLSRVELTNNTLDLAFAVEVALPVNSTLTGDMDARATGAPRSAVTVDGQSKYGAWQHPRTEFRLRPGSNELSLATVPAGASVRCEVEFRSTWSG